MPQQQGRDLTSLDGLIAGLGGAAGGTRSTGPCGLLMEHLQAARRGLLGAMRGEYVLNLEQAKESVACIPDRASRTSTKATLQHMIDSAADANAA
ncbi:MAG TPA: hypothetical protein VN841_00905 [Bryobacteraceae bacterium]|nr:hypothetical protein [Bryobacteraceae bacterium]